MEGVGTGLVLAVDASRRGVTGALLPSADPTVTLGRRMVKESRAVPLVDQKAETFMRLPLTATLRNSKVLLRLAVQFSGGPAGCSFSPPPPVTR